MGSTKTPKPDQTDEEEQEAKPRRKAMVGVPRRAWGKHAGQSREHCVWIEQNG